MTFLYVKIFLFIVVALHLVIYLLRRRLYFIWGILIKIAFWGSLSISILTIFTAKPYEIMVEKAYQKNKVHYFFERADYWTFQNKKLPTRVKIGINDFLDQWTSDFKENTSNLYWNLLHGEPVGEWQVTEFELPEIPYKKADYNRFEQEIYPKFAFTTMQLLRWTVFTLCLLLLSVSLHSFLAISADFDNKAQQEQIKILEEKIRILENRVRI